MTTITASQVKELRERTGSGMMECKKALQAAQGDLEAAVVAMRKSGQAKAAKRAGRVAAEGAVKIMIDQAAQTGFIVEVNSETDFVSRGDQFKGFVESVAKRGLTLQASDAQALLQAPFVEGDGKAVEQVREELIAQVGENIHVRRAASLKAAGALGAYQHGDRIAVLVAIDQDQPELARDIAMHIAATNPLSISENDLPAAELDKERDIFTAQAKESGKPDNIIEKMVEGRMSKFLKEVCLVSQPFIKDPDTTIAQLLKSKQAQVTSFIRFEVGEGVEKQQQDFAEEVKAQLQED